MLTTTIVVSARNANAFDSARRRRRSDRLSAAGMGRRLLFYVQAYGGWLLRQLPGDFVNRRSGSARNRHHLCVRPRCLQEAVTPMVRMADAGALKRKVFDFLHRVSPVAGRFLGGEKVPPTARAALQRWQSSHLWTCSRIDWDFAHPVASPPAGRPGWGNFTSARRRR